MKINDVVNLTIALQKLKNSTLNIKDAYKIQKMAMIVEPEIMLIHKQRHEIFEKHGCINKNTGEVAYPNKEIMKKVENDLIELHSLETDLNITPIDISYSDDIMLSANDLSAIDKYIKISGINNSLDEVENNE